MANVPEFLITARPQEQWAQDPSLVQSKVHFEEMLHELLSTPRTEHTGRIPVSIDTETNGLSPVNPDHKIVGVSLSSPNKDFYIPLRHITPEPQLKDAGVFKALRRVLFENQDVLLIGHNWKFDYNKFGQDDCRESLEWRFKAEGVWDTQIGWWLLDENQKDDDAWYRIQPGMKAKWMAYRLPKGQKDQYPKIPVLDHFEIPSVQQLAGFSLKALSNKVLGIPMLEFFDEVVKKYGVPYREIAMHIGGNYAKLDTKGTMALFIEEEPRIYKEKLDKVFWKMEMPYVRVLANMERRGIPVSRKQLGMLHDICVDGMDKSMQKIEEFAGHPVNPNSGPQMAKLAEEQGLPILKRTEKGAPSFDEETIERLAEITGNPAILEIVKFKQFKKMVGTYIDGNGGLRTLIDIDGRVHPSILHTGTVTGRLAVIEPAAQTWPANPIMTIPLNYDTVKDMKDSGVDLEEQFDWAVKIDDKEQKASMAVHLRDCITELETRPGWRLVVADFSQMELRMLSHFAKDEKLKAGFLAGVDIHKYNASVVHGKDIEEVTSEERRDAKAVSFGTVYGKTSKGFAEDFFGKMPDFYKGVDRRGEPKINKKYMDKAQETIDNFFSAFPASAEWITRVHKEVRTKGYIRTMSGRKRRLPWVWDESIGIQNRALRQAVNTYIQGSSADFIKAAMILLEDALDSLSVGEAEMLMQVHDELIFAVSPEANLEEVIKLIQDKMENPAKLFCPMVAEPGVCWRYGSGK